MTVEPPIDLETNANTDVEAIVKAYEPSCFKCSKFNICYIWRDMSRILVQNIGGVKDEQQIPIKINDLAKICAQYYPKTNGDPQ